MTAEPWPPSFLLPCWNAHPGSHDCGYTLAAQDSTPNVGLTKSQLRGTLSSGCWANK